MAISTVSDPSGSGRVDMLTGPVAAARAGVKSKHDMYLIVEVWELKLYFYPSAGGLKKKKKVRGVVSLIYDRPLPRSSNRGVRGRIAA